MNHLARAASRQYNRRYSGTGQILTQVTFKTVLASNMPAKLGRRLPTVCTHVAVAWQTRETSGREWLGSLLAELLVSRMWSHIRSQALGRNSTIEHDIVGREHRPLFNLLLCKGASLIARALPHKSVSCISGGLEALRLSKRVSASAQFEIRNTIGTHWHVWRVKA